MTLEEILALPASAAAPRLLGGVLASRLDGHVTAVALTEVEAYEPDDPASHSYGGPTARNRSMFQAPGTLYVYRSYGIHWCANVVTGRGGSAVLFRAGRPIEGLEIMASRRGRSDSLADGPGKLAQALGIDGTLDGVGLVRGEWVELTGPASVVPYRSTARVGITKATDRPWRFVADR